MPATNPRQRNQCSICRAVKSPDDFYMGMKRGKVIQLPKCKQCAKRLSALEREKRAEKIKERAVKNREKNIEYLREYRKKNAEALREKDRIRYQKRKNDPSYKKQQVEAMRRARLIPSFQVKSTISARLSSILRGTDGAKKRMRTMDLIGCELDFLIRHLESLFSKGMTWKNRGKNGWHVDHIIPCCTFDHLDEKQVRQCWHWTNLRPMWAKDNLSKGSKVTEPQMKLLL